MARTPRGPAFLNKEPDANVKGDVPVDAARAEFARRLQKALVEKGWTQSELARKAEVVYGKRFGRDSISQYIRGETFPSPAKLGALAKVLGTTPQQLLPTKGIRGVHTAMQEMEVRSLGDGTTWFSINQALPQDVALRLMSVLHEYEQSKKPDDK